MSDKPSPHTPSSPKTQQEPTPTVPAISMGIDRPPTPMPPEYTTLTAPASNVTHTGFLWIYDSDDSDDSDSALPPFALTSTITPEEFRTLKNINPEKDTECSICTNLITVGIQLQCNHVFHEACIFVWATQHARSCPVCRRDILGGT